MLQNMGFLPGPFYTEIFRDLKEFGNILRCLPFRTVVVIIAVSCGDHRDNGFLAADVQEFPKSVSVPDPHDQSIQSQFRGL